MVLLVRPTIALPALLLSSFQASKMLSWICLHWELLGRYIRHTRLLTIYLNSHSYQSLKIDGLFVYFSSCFLQKNLMYYTGFTRKRHTGDKLQHLPTVKHMWTLGEVLPICSRCRAMLCCSGKESLLNIAWSALEAPSRVGIQSRVNQEGCWLNAWIFCYV